jgi:hypothetical protein
MLKFAGKAYFVTLTPSINPIFNQVLGVSHNVSVNFSPCTFLIAEVQYIAGI